MKLSADQKASAVAVLEKLVIFRGCPKEAIPALTQELEIIVARKGKVVIMEQEISKSLFLLIEGSVGIWRRVKGEKTQLAVLDAPNFFGETSMFTPLPATALVKSEADAILYVLGRPGFDAVVAKFPSVGPTVEHNVEIIRANRPAITQESEPKA